jgi:hypothetical protein
MCYMMSSQGYLNDSAGHWLPHLMFYIPLTDPKVWGADLPGSPVMLNPQFQGAPEPITEFMIPVGHWSDGTAVRPKSERWRFDSERLMAMWKKIAGTWIEQVNDGRFAGVAALWKAGSANALFSGTDKVFPSPRAKRRRSPESR